MTADRPTNDSDLPDGVAPGIARAAHKKWKESNDSSTAERCNALVSGMNCTASVGHEGRHQFNFSGPPPAPAEQPERTALDERSDAARRTPEYAREKADLERSEQPAAEARDDGDPTPCSICKRPWLNQFHMDESHPKFHRFTTVLSDSTNPNVEAMRYGGIVRVEAKQAATIKTLRDALTFIDEELWGEEIKFEGSSRAAVNWYIYEEIRETLAAALRGTETLAQETANQN